MERRFLKAALGIASTLSISALAVWLTFLYHKQGTYYETLKEKQSLRMLRVIPKPAPIYDATGHILAKTIQVTSVFIDPRFIADPAQTASTLSDLLHLPSETFLTQKIQEAKTRKRRFLWVKRKLPLEEETAFLQAKKNRKNKSLDGVFLQKEYQRVYPYGSLLSQVLGFRGPDMEPLAGAELSLNTLLVGKPRLYTYSVDARKVPLFGIVGLSRAGEPRPYPLAGQPRLNQAGEPPPYDMLYQPDEGTPVVLSIDINLQYLMEDVLDQAFATWKPKSLTAIMLNPSSGEVLALANRPTFDPNTYSLFPLSATRNLAVTDPSEPGSTFKPIVLSTLLEENKVTSNEKVFCENGHFRYRHRLLTDHTPYGWLSVEDVIAHSSDIGMDKLALRLTPAELWNTLGKFGFFQKTGIELPAESHAHVTPFPKWSYYTMTSIPIGYEILPTSLQMARAYAALANNGHLLPLTILKGPRLHAEPPEIFKRRIFRERTHQILLEALRKVVSYGTATKAFSNHYDIVGKTGTAKKISTDGRYTAQEHLAYFIGFAPAQHPRILVYLRMNSPQKAYYGGTVCAPYVKEILEKSLFYLGVPPEMQERIRETSPSAP